MNMSDSDPECTQIIAPGRPPVTGGGIRCVPLPTPDSNGHNQYDDWCGEAIDQLISQAPLKFCREPTTTTTTKLHPWFTCPTPTATPECPLPVPQIATTYSDWECEPTCSYKKPFLRIRQVVKDGIKPSLQCQGPNNSSCTFYADAACSIPLPDQPKPMNNTGASCNESSWDWWCSAVRNYNNPVSASFPYKRRCEYTKYTCIESCDDGTKRNIAVWVDPDGQISCLWNRTWGTCLEFPDGECYDESGKAYEDEEQSRPCPEMGMKGWPGSDWCSHAEDVLRRNGARTCTVETPVIQTVMGTSVSNAEALGVLWAGRAAFIISIALFNML